MENNLYGMNRTNGKKINHVEHLKQSIIDILTTKKGSRVKRRNYGSNLFFLVDKPINASLLLSIYAETARALIENEPRIILNAVKINTIVRGIIDLSLRYTYNATDIKLDNIRLNYAR